MVLVEAASDAELIARVRGGDLDAYAQLYGRHVDAARTLALRCTRSAADADDVVAHAFEAVLGALQRGNGPDEAFRAYLFTTIRRSAARQAGSKVEPSDDGELDSVEPFIDPAIAGLERTLVARAFLSLPERWQTVLWHTEIESQSPAEVADIVGLRPNAVAALAYRAREGLRQAYLQLQLAEAGAAHKETIDKLGAYARDALSPTERAKVEAHLDQCERCKAAYLEMVDMNSALVRSVAPLFLGAGAAGYLAAGAAKVGAAGGLVFRLVRKLRQPVVAGGVAVGSVAAAAVVAFGLSQFGGDGGPPSEVAAAEAPATTTRPPTTTTTTTVPTTTTTISPSATEPPAGQPFVVITTTTVEQPAAAPETPTTTEIPPTVIQPADLGVTYTPDSQEVDATNFGTTDVTDAVVVITLQNAVFPASNPGIAPWSCHRDSNSQLTCQVPSLPPSGTSRETLHFLVAQSKTAVVTARISSASIADADSSNNCAGAC